MAPKIAKLLNFCCENEIEYDFSDKPIVGEHCERLKSLEESREEREKELNVVFLRHCVCDALFFNPEISQKCRFIRVKTQLCITFQTNKMSATTLDGFKVSEKVRRRERKS